jgi:hypothetical protein
LGLVFFALRVGEVGSFVGVDGETELAFKGAQMVRHKVRVFGEVDGFHGEFGETFATHYVGV